MQAQLMTATPILEVFVHEDESDDPQVLARFRRPLTQARAQRVLDAFDPTS